MARQRPDARLPAKALRKAELRLGIRDGPVMLHNGGNIQRKLAGKHAVRVDGRNVDFYVDVQRLQLSR